MVEFLFKMEEDNTASPQVTSVSQDQSRKVTFVVGILPWEMGIQLRVPKSQQLAAFLTHLSEG